MRIKEFTLTKKFKKGLPNYSSVDVGVGMTVEVPEGEEPDFTKAWDIINQQLSIQSDSIDPSWITETETKKDYKFTIKVPKNEKTK